MTGKQQVAFRIPAGFSSVHLLSDTNTFKYCYPLVKDHLPDHKILKVAAGEKSKNLANCERIWKHLLKHKADRQSLLINLGGGMICDLGGFAAANYKRGIAFINIPTTLLAMVDAGFGGKTGINFGNVKNSIGLYMEPADVIVRHIFLKTLPHREYSAGIAEVLKHAIVYDRKLFVSLSKLKSNESLPQNLILQAAKVKTAIVKDDPYEKGLRKILNFGHTIGHALEALSLKRKRPILHGEAVATGMMIETCIALHKGIISADDTLEILQLGFKLCEPHSTGIKLSELVPLLYQDKKNVNGDIRMSLPTAIGRCAFDVPVSPREIYESLLSIRI